MVKQFKVEGTEEGTISISVDGKSTTLSVDADIQAESIYNSLQYQPKDTYVFEDGGAGKMAQAPYDAFRDFLKDIVTQVNKLANNGNEESDEGNEDSGESDVTIAGAGETSFITTEDIPF